jgi:hypothetical protein
VIDEPNSENLKLLQGPLSVCSAAIKEMETKLRPASEKLTTRRKLMWPFESKKLDEILARIQEQKATLSLALTTDSAYISRQIHAGVEDIKLSIQSAETREKREKILTWLHPNDPKSKHLKCRHDHRAGTNKWVFEHEMFKTWLSEGQSVLWVSL